MTEVTLTWLGEQVLQQVTQQLAGGLSKFTEELAAAARQNLYPGHGYLTGNLQSRTRAEAVRLLGSSLEGSVGSFGVPYGMVVHDRYNYIVDALHRLSGSAANTIARG